MPIAAIVEPATQRRITTPARAMALGGEALGSCDVGAVEAALDAVSAAICAYLGWFVFRERVIESASLYGGVSLVLERRPLVELHGVTLDDEPVDAACYVVDALDPAILRFAGYDRRGMLCPHRMRIEYTAGWVPHGGDEPATMPADIEAAAVEGAKGRLGAGGVGDQGFVSRKQLGDHSVAWAGGDAIVKDALAGRGGLPAAATAILDRYRAAAYIP